MNTSAEKLEIGVIGGGEGAAKALSGLIHCEAVRVNAVACKENELQDLIEPRHRISTCDLLQNTDITAVYIATPNNTHMDLAIDALKAGKHILIEKPLAARFRETSRLVFPGEKMPGIAVAFKKRFGDGILFLKDILPTFKSPLKIEVKWHNPAPTGNWRYNHEISGGGVVPDLGSHVLDLLESLFGRIYSIDAKLKMARKFPKIDEEALIKLNFVNGHSAEIDLSWRQKTSCQMYSFLSSDKAFHLVRQTDGTDLGTVISAKQSRTVSFSQSSEYIGLFTAWKDAIEMRKMCVPLLEDGRRNQSLLQLISGQPDTGLRELSYNKDNCYGFSD